MKKKVMTDKEICDKNKKIMEKNFKKFSKLPNIGPIETKRIDILRNQLEQDCNNDEISSKKLYLVNYEGTWYIGTFSKQWYGWSFDEAGWVSPQLNSLSAVYEISNLPKLPNKFYKYIPLNNEDEDEY